MKKTKFVIEIETDKMKTFKDECDSVEDDFHQVIKEKIEDYLQEEGLVDDVLNDERLIRENGDFDTFTDYCEKGGFVKITISELE